MIAEMLTFIVALEPASQAVRELTPLTLTPVETVEIVIRSIILLIMMILVLKALCHGFQAKEKRDNETIIILLLWAILCAILLQW